MKKLFTQLFTVTRTSLNMEQMVINEMYQSRTGPSDGTENKQWPGYVITPTNCQSYNKNIQMGFVPKWSQVLPAFEPEPFKHHSVKQSHTLKHGPFLFISLNNSQPGQKLTLVPSITAIIPPLTHFPAFRKQTIARL